MIGAEVIKWVGNPPVILTLTHLAGPAFAGEPTIGQGFLRSSGKTAPEAWSACAVGALRTAPPSGDRAPTLQYLSTGAFFVTNLQ